MKDKLLGVEENVQNVQRDLQPMKNRRNTFNNYKKDGNREPYDRNKILNGILKACEKGQYL